MKMVYPIDNLIPEIVSDDNMYDSFDYVIGHLEYQDQRKYYKPLRYKFVTSLQQEIGNGTFRILRDEVKDIMVTDGPKVREVQATRVYKRVGIHAIMVIVEKYTYPTLIKNSAASIKGRGMHWLHHIVEDDLINAPKIAYYYQNDIEHYYDSIDQTIMMHIIRRYISDVVLLPILDSFVALMPAGLSKGLRSSQCFANLYLSSVDKVMLQHVGSYESNGEVRYLYYRYCDDVVILSDSKKKLWRLRDVYVNEIAKLGLNLKNNDAVRPVSEGLDFLGFVHFEDFSLLRKRVKQKAARKLAHVKSRKRRQQIIGAFKGMAVHADCKNLFFKLTGKYMKDIGEVKVRKTEYADGKKRFPGVEISPKELVKKAFVIVDFEKNVIPRRERERFKRDLLAANGNAEAVEPAKGKWLVSIIYDGQPRKLWTGLQDNIAKLVAAEEEQLLPLSSSIIADYGGRYPCYKFCSALALNLTVPSDEEINNIIKLNDMTIAGQ